MLIHTHHPEGRVRLETRPERGIRLDLLIVIEGRRIAIDLKYPVSRFEGSVRGERSDLPNQAAQDISRHDVVKVIVRVERFVADDVADVGWAIAPSNDQGYWRPGWKVWPTTEEIAEIRKRREEGLTDLVELVEGSSPRRPTA